MGSGVTKEDRQLSQISKQISHDLARDYQEERQKIKLLLLGPAECGKSTVLKQMKILHSGGFPESEYTAAKSIIHENVIASICLIVEAMSTLGISFDNPARKTDARIVLEADANKSLQIAYELYTSDVVHAIRRLWNDAGVKKCVLRGSEFQLIDSAEYYLSDVERICAADYRPSVQDILRARTATTGIVEVPFVFNKTKFRVFDVGGQRSERRKWIHCFDNVDAIIFIVALSEYDQMMREDANTNRLVDALHLFSSICNCHWFCNTNVILFLNKKDIFEQRIKLRPITAAFPDYKGAQTYEEASTFIGQKFSEKNRNSKRQIYPHKTCGTDTNQVQVVLEASLETIMRENMSKIGI